MSGPHLNLRAEPGIIGGVNVDYFMAGAVVEEITNVSRKGRKCEISESTVHSSEIIQTAAEY